jgi:GTPase SAR1 family protein
MSAVIRGRFPFLNKSLLVEAINRCKKFKIIESNGIQKEDVLLFRKGTLENLGYFLFGKGAYTYYSALSESQSFEITKEINQYYLEIVREIEQKKEDERKKEEQIKLQEIERQKRLYIEQKKQEITVKAKAMGYQVKEEKVGKLTKLILVKREY